MKLPQNRSDKRNQIKRKKKRQGEKEEEKQTKETVGSRKLIAENEIIIPFRGTRSEGYLANSKTPTGY